MYRSKGKYNLFDALPYRPATPVIVIPSGFHWRVLFSICCDFDFDFINNTGRVIESVAIIIINKIELTIIYFLN